MNQARHQRLDWRSAQAPILWVLFAVAVYGPWIHLEIGQGNVASDLAAIESLVERRTFYINGATFDTIDKFKLGGNFFSQKSPIFHLVAGVPFAALNAAGLNLREHAVFCLRVLTLIMVIVPMGLLLWMIWDHPWVRPRSMRWRVGFTVIFALGSALTPFAVTLNHYVPAAACLMMAARRMVELNDRRPFRDGIEVGFWISASMACDVPPAFLFGCGVGAAWLLQSARPEARRRLAGLACGAAPLLLFYAALNYKIFGSTLPPNFHQEEMLYFEGSFWKEIRDRALAGNPEYYQASYIRRLWHSMFGHKGIYWMFPLIGVATAAAIWLTKRRALHWQTALAFALFPPVTIAIAMIWAFDLSGGAYAIRHCLAALPPLFVLLAHPSLPRLTCTFKGIVALFAAWGMLIGAIGFINPWSHNTLSAYPPLENLARLALRHPGAFPTRWVGPTIDATSVKPANGWLDLGLAWVAQGDRYRAIHAFTQALQIDPDYTLAMYHLGIELSEAGRMEEAIGTYLRLVQLEPENVAAWNNLATFAIETGRLDFAKQALITSHRLAPGNYGMVYRRLLIEEIEGRNTADSPVLIEALRLYPDDERLGRLARRWGRPQNERQN